MKTRFLLIPAIAALALAGCNDSGTATSGGEGRTAYEQPTDHAIGDPNAPVTVVEYASVVCSHCANWSETVYPEFKEKYIDTGDVRYVFREFPTSPVELFDVGVMIANCADDRKPGAFFDSIKLQFERQGEILRYAQQARNQVRDQYEYIARQGGMSPEEMQACLADESIREEYQARSQLGYDAGISGTPAFFINGEVAKVFTLEEFDEAIANAKASTGS